MTLLLPLLAFVFGSLLVTAVSYALTARSAGMDERLRDVVGLQPGETVNEESNEQVVSFLKRVGERLPKSTKDLSTLRVRLIQAGYRRPEALPVFFAIRAGCALGMFALSMTPLVGRPSLLMAIPRWASGTSCRRCCSRGWPRSASIASGSRSRTRSTCMVVSVEAGLGLDQALARVGQELASAHPDLSAELRLVNLELLAGTGRSDALRNLADRTGVDDLSSLVAMLVQTDKFGTSVANSLRVFSDTLRTKRRQRAEEAAAKTGVKMVFPLVLCIFPAIWIVTIGPAAIKFIEVLGPVTNNVGK